MTHREASGSVGATSRRRLLGAGLAVVVAGGVSGCSLLQPTPEEPEDRCAAAGGSITFIGDSLTNGTSNDSGASHRFPSLVARELLVTARVLASNGSGYVAVGPATDARDFPGQADLVKADTNIVVIFGSRNDMSVDEDPSAAITENARRTYDRVRENAPGVHVVVIGPPWINDDPSEEILQVRDAVRTAAEDAGLDWVDPLEEGWFAEQDQLLPDGRHRGIAEDRIHPNDEGHAYLAQRILPIIAERVCTP